MTKPIVTVTTNAGIDYIILLKNFEIGKYLRADSELIGIGGKGANVSNMISQLGYPTYATGFVAEDVAKRLSDLLNDIGATNDFVSVNGFGRNVHIIVDSIYKKTTVISADTLVVCPKHIESLYKKIEEWVKKSEWLVLGGIPPKSVPIECYSEIIRTANSNGVKTLLDFGGSALSYCLKSKVNIIKINLEEIQSIFNNQLKTLKDIKLAACELIGKGVEIAIVTLGKNGVIAATKNDAYYINALDDCEVVNTSGAGDAFTAGLIVNLSNGKNITESLCFAMAVAQSAVTAISSNKINKYFLNDFLKKIRIENL